MLVNIILAIVLFGNLPKEFKKDRFPKNKVKEILLEVQPQSNIRKDMKIDKELTGGPEFFLKESVTTCIFKGFDNDGNIIVEIPDYVPSRKIKMVNPVILNKAGKEVVSSSLKPGEWIKVFIDDKGNVRGILISPLVKEVSR